jgi:hypothetical protein
MLLAGKTEEHDCGNNHRAPQNPWKRKKESSFFGAGHRPPLLHFQTTPQVAIIVTRSSVKNQLMKPETRTLVIEFHARIIKEL